MAEAKAREGLKQKTKLVRFLNLSVSLNCLCPGFVDCLHFTVSWICPSPENLAFPSVRPWICPCPGFVCVLDLSLSWMCLSLDSFHVCYEYVFP